METCAALTFPDTPWAYRAAIDPQLQRPDDRIDGQDFSGQDLANRSFHGKVLINVNLRGARLRGGDLSDAVICHSDLRNADLTGARLDRALIGGGTELQGANFTRASARDMQIADASGAIRIDRADLRGARIWCDFVNTGAYCIAQHDMAFASMVGADLRGARIDHLGSPPGLATARLDGMTTQLESNLDFVQLAASVGEAGRITFVPNEFNSGHPTQFTGAELRQIPAAFRRMHAASTRPSFDCARARTRVEKAICADPRLAALDRALDWLWQSVERTPQQKAAQTRWLQTRWFHARAHCPPPAEDSRRSSAPLTDPPGCIGLAYAERITELAPLSTSASLQAGTYTTDDPLELPPGRYATLAEKFLVARGFRMDEISVRRASTHAAQISGGGVWPNGHMCGLAATENDTAERVGAQFRITDLPGQPRDDPYSLSLVITPPVVVRIGGANQFQCGARGGWSDAYFRQPDGLVAKVVNPRDPF